MSAQFQVGGISPKITMSMSVSDMSTRDQWELFLALGNAMDRRGVIASWDTAYLTALGKSQAGVK